MQSSARDGAGSVSKLFFWDVAIAEDHVALTLPISSQCPHSILHPTLTSHDQHINTITESETLLFGTNFGVVTDIQTGPHGNIFAVPISQWAVYEIHPVSQKCR